jgi:hypothetical protein
VFFFVPVRFWTLGNKEQFDRELQDAGTSDKSWEQVRPGVGLARGSLNEAHLGTGYNSARLGGCGETAA